MNRRKVLKFMTLSSLGGTLPMFNLAHAQGKKYEFVNHTYSNDVLYDLVIIRWFYEELEKRSNGRYTAKFYYNEALTKAADQGSAAASGTIDSFFNSLGYNPAEFRLNRVFEHIGITNSFYVQGKAIMDLYNSEPLIRQEWDKQDIVLIAPVLQTEMAITTKQPVRKPEDLRGLKLRGYAQSGQALSMLGSEILTIAAPERYDALAKGVVDGMSGIAVDVAYGERLHEMSPHFVDIGLGVYSFTYFAMGKSTFDSLPEEDQAMIQELGAEILEKMSAGFPELYERIIPEMVSEYGATFYEFTDEQRQTVLDTVLPTVWEDWIAEMDKAGLPGERVLKQYIEAVEKHAPSDTYKSAFALYREMYPDAV